MKKALYTLLMIILSVLVCSGLYLSTIYSLVFYKIVDLRSVISFTDMTMSREAWGLVVIIAIIIGYRMAMKWWQIIYVDKVYYFARPTRAPQNIEKRVTKKRETVK